MTGWGPDARRAAFCLTFDNLGEAALIEQGRWPESRPVGSHPSVTDTLPRVLEALDGLRATFFIEAWNAEVYPAAFEAIASAGHEIALHGWRHEPWQRLEPERERRLLARSVRALDAVGVVPAGFRPPGGGLSAASRALFREHGLTYCSPAGACFGVEDAIATLPFSWHGVDAYYLDAVMAPLRERHGDGRAPLPLARFEAAAEGIVEGALTDAGCGLVILHPYLLADPAHLGLLARFARRLLATGELWTAPCRDVATQLRAHSRTPASPPG